MNSTKIGDPYELTLEISHLFDMKEEGRDKQEDGPKCIALVKKLEAIAREVYGISDDDPSQQTLHD